MTTGSAAMFTVKPDTPMANVYGFRILLGAGTGMIFNAGYTVGGVKTMLRTGSCLDVQRVISMINLSQRGFQLGGLLIGGQIFQSLAMKNLTSVLNGLGFSRDDIRSAVAGTQSTLFASRESRLAETSYHGYQESHEPGLYHQHDGRRDHGDQCGVDEKGEAIPICSTQNRHCGRGLGLVPVIGREECGLSDGLFCLLCSLTAGLTIRLRDVGSLQGCYRRAAKVNKF